MLTENQKVELYKRFKVACLEATEVILLSESSIESMSNPLTKENKDFAKETLDFVGGLFGELDIFVKDSVEFTEIVSKEEADKVAEDILRFMTEKLLTFGSRHSYIANEKDVKSILLITSAYNLHSAELQLKNL